MDRTAIMIYLVDAPSFLMLSDHDAGCLFKAMLLYVMDGIDPKFEGTLALAWSFVRPKLDLDGERYQTKVVKKRYAVYCREMKRLGKEPETFEEWENCDHLISCDDRTISNDIPLPSPLPKPLPSPLPKPLPSPLPKPLPSPLPKEKKCGFTPPTVAEVEAYCLERDNGIDAEAFVAFYESNGWMVGKNKMKNWKSAVITWEKSSNRKRDQKKLRSAEDYRKDVDECL